MRKVIGICILAAQFLSVHASSNLVTAIYYPDSASLRRKWSMGFESYVFNNTYSIWDGNTFLNIHQDKLPDFGYSFSPDINAGHRTFKIDSNGVKKKNDWEYPYHATVFESYGNLNLYIRQPIKIFRRSTIYQSFGLNFSWSACEIGSFFVDRYWIDTGVSGNHSTTGYDIDSTNSLTFYRINKRLGINYTMEGELLLSRNFRFSVQCRFGLHQPLQDDTRIYYDAYTGPEPGPPERGVVSLPSLFPYNQGPYQEFRTMRRKLLLHWDMSLYLKPQFALGKKSQLYFLIGLNCFSGYRTGGEVRFGSAATYGLGYSRNL